MATGDEVGVDLPFCVSECEGRGGWACSVDDGGGFGLKAVNAGGGDWVSQRRWVRRAVSRCLDNVRCKRRPLSRAWE